MGVGGPPEMPTGAEKTLRILYWVLATLVLVLLFGSGGLFIVLWVPGLGAFVEDAGVQVILSWMIVIQVLTIGVVGFVLGLLRHRDKDWP